MLGTTFANFRILERVDQNPTDDTYSGEDTRSADAVVIRVIRAEAMADVRVRQRILQAARAGCSLQHANVCGPYYFEESAGALLVVAPRLDAESLGQRLAAGPFAIEETLEIAIQAAQGLAAIHAARFVHGHLSPRQILLAPRPDGPPLVKLVNAGLGVTVDAYAAPECAAGQDATAVSDIWSLGSIVKEMLGGVEVQGSVRAALARALAADPAARVQSAAEFAALLQKPLVELRELLPTVVLDAGPEPAPTIVEAPIAVRSFFSLEEGAGGASQPPESRYVDIGLLGKGGMAEVRRVRDLALNRVVAMKVMKPEAEWLRTRFVQEARITAQLQHPAIVPVYEIGTLADGRFYFTMKEVQGQTLAAVIATAHAHWRAPEEAPAFTAPWTLRQLIGILQRASEGVGYAHDRGVLHRDIKPSNIMIGAFGEVLVLDWGLTRVGESAPADAAAPAARPEIEPITDDSRAGDRTRFGSVLGTPGFMSPEQAAGDPERVTAASDVFSLGCALFDILAGSAPFDDPHLPTKELGPRAGGEHGPVIPPELREICGRAMEQDPVDRFRNAGEFADALAAWLDGAQRREQAMRVLEQARVLRPQVQEVRREAATLEQNAADILAVVPPFAPVDAKRAAWAMQDRARELRSEAEALDARFANTVHAALTLADDLAPAHDILADYYKERHAAAEAARDRAAVVRYETLLRVHDSGRFASYLRGDGALTLVTDPPGAHVALFRFEEIERRMVPQFAGELGFTPIRKRSMPMGSYLVKLSHPGRVTVDYPVFIERELHWDGVRPGGSNPFPVYLPHPADLREDECYIPAGWFWSGGDPKARNSLPARRLWLDAFLVPRFPVTIAEYLAMLNDLAAAGREDEAAAALPLMPEYEERVKAAERDFGFSRDASGRYVFEGGDERLRLPMVLLSWHQARAYAEWRARHERLSWHLIQEMEHEKAGRGADGRAFPWGNYLDPTFCMMRDSRAGAVRALRCTVDEYPLDESPYGVRGLSGNTHSWCEDAYSPSGPEIVKSIPRPPDPATLKGPGGGGVHRLVRGGSYRDPETYCRMAFRDSPPAMFRVNNIGFRVARFLM